MKYKVGDKVTVEICNYEKDAIITDINELGIEVRIAPNYSDCLVFEEERIKQTNRQWLESLSDEEFAEFLTSDNWVCKDIDADLCWFSGSNISCRQCKKQWLQAEHVEREY